MQYEQMSLGEAYSQRNEIAAAGRAIFYTQEATGTTFRIEFTPARNMQPGQYSVVLINRSKPSTIVQMNSKTPVVVTQAPSQ
jgi:hypothetical protein